MNKQRDEIGWNFEMLTGVRLDLLKKNILLLDGEIDGDMALYFQESFNYLESKDSPDIRIDISSNGGNSIQALNIYDLVRLYKGKTTGRVNGAARSAAVNILQASDVRECMEHSLILIHNTVDDEGNEFKKCATQEMMKDVLRKKMNPISDQDLDELLEADKNLSAKEALSYGLIDLIL